MKPPTPRSEPPSYVPHAVPFALSSGPSDGCGRRERYMIRVPECNIFPVLRSVRVNNEFNRVLCLFDSVSLNKDMCKQHA